jgi:HemY protein
MKLLLTLIAVLLITAVVTLLAMNKPGYVMLAFGKTSVEMPLIDFIVLLLGVFVLLYALIRFLLVLKKTPRALRRRREGRRDVKYRQGMVKGLVEMAEGNWAKAERRLVATAGKGSEPALLNYLAAAHSAQRQHANDRRDEYLRLASEASPEAEVAVGLTQAELQVRARQYEEALATLKHLQEIAPRHPHVLKQLARLRYELKEWPALMEMLPQLHKSPVLQPEEVSKFEAAAVSGMMRKAGQTGDLEQLQALWKHLPKNARQEVAILEAYGCELLRLGDIATAEPLLRKQLNEAWDDRLGRLYAQLKLENPKAALGYAEKWLEKYSANPVLLATAGRLNAQAKLWGRARSLYQESLNLKPEPRTYAYLGELLETMGEAEAARTAYQTGLRLASQS